RSALFIGDGPGPQALQHARKILPADSGKKGALGQYFKNFLHFPLRLLEFQRTFLPQYTMIGAESQGGMDMIRRIIRIDEEKCNGCGACADACHEGAIEMIDGKARLMREDYCDGLGDCLPACPAGAIS